jgi:hypothetical protein
VARQAKRTRDGRTRIKLRSDEATVIEAFLRDLADALESDELESETRARLFPRAYLDPTEESAEQVWQSVVHDDLLTGRVAALRAVMSDIGQAEAVKGDLVIELDAERETEWMMAINDARLVIGTALDVSEDRPLDIASDDPRYALVGLYYWFSSLQDDLVEVLLDTLPETGID